MYKGLTQVTRPLSPVIVSVILCVLFSNFIVLLFLLFYLSFDLLFCIFFKRSMFYGYFLLLICSLTASVLVYFDYIEKQNQNIFQNIQIFCVPETKEISNSKIENSLFTHPHIIMCRWVYNEFFILGEIFFSLYNTAAITVGFIQSSQNVLAWYYEF